MDNDNFYGYIALDVSEIRLIDDDESIGSEISSVVSPLLNELRSLAKVEFVLCHSLPAVNSNGAAWTYPTLVNSFKTVKNNLVNLNHELKDNQKLLNKRAENKVIGHMIDATIKELPVDENGLFPLVPSEPVAIIVTAYLYKRVVPDLVERLKRGEKLKISMECEFTEVGFIVDGKMYSRQERPDLLGQRTFEGNPVIRVLGGIDPSGGVVNFWGAAVLDNQKPADKDAEVLSAVASAIGTGDSTEDFIHIIEEPDMKKFLSRLSVETAAILGPLLETKVEDLTDENIAHALIQQIAKVKELEAQIANIINNKEESANIVKEGEPAAENAELIGSMEEYIARTYNQIRDGLRASATVPQDRDFYIVGVLPNSVIIDLFEENQFITYAVSYEMDESGKMIFGNKVRVALKQVVVPYSEESASKEDLKEGDAEMANENTEVAEVQAVEGDESVAADNAEAAGTDATANEATVATDNEEAPEAVASEAEQELASLKSRIEELVTQNLELKNRLSALETEKEEARRKSVLASRKAALSEDFDLEELLDEGDELSLMDMSDDEFTSFAAKMKKIAAKAKFVAKSGSPSIDTRVSQDVDLVGGKPGEKGKPVGDAPPIDTSIKDDVLEANKRGNKNIASDTAEEEVAATETAVAPLSPEVPARSDLKNKFFRF